MTDTKPNGQPPAAAENKAQAAKKKPAPRQAPATKTKPAPKAAPMEITVICHVPGGRRRADHRWEEGETKIAADELSAEQIQQLQGDPRFTVIGAD